MSTTPAQHLDDALAPIRAAAPQHPARGWVNAVRRALGMTEAELAARMGVTQPSVHALENSEAAGTVRLDTLRRAAEALGCEVVYTLVPRRPLAETLVARARDTAREELGRVQRTMSLEAQDVEVSDADVEARAKEILDRGRLWRT